MTATQIFVGIGYATNGDAANAALGAANITTGNERADAKAVVDDINAHGGIAGRTLVPVWHAFNAQSTDPVAQQEQAACADYTQDHHSFVVAQGGALDDFVACVTKSAVLVAGGELALYGQPDFAQYPYLVDPDTLNVDRQGAAMVSMLVHQGYFSPWDATFGRPGTTAAKVGILSIDIPAWNHELDKVMLPDLAADNILVNPADVYRIYNPSSSAQDGTTVNDISNAELRMRQDGVDHVIVLDAGGSLTLLFANDANSQHYYPRFGVNSAAGLGTLANGGDIQQASAAGAEGLGYWPSVDLTSADNPPNGPYATPAQRHCLALMQAAGQSFTSANAAGVAFDYCDQLYFIRQVIDSIRGAITRNSLVAAVDQLGSSFGSATFQRTFLGPSQHDGVTVGYDMRYVSACNCTRYFGTVTIP